MPESHGRKWLALALLCTVQFMVVLDIAIVNVALPSIAAGLGFAPADLQWVVTAYVLCSGGLLLVGGRAADLLGRRRMFLAGLALFTAASLACGLAPSPGALIAARAAQGVGAALLTPAALSIITATYSGAQRATALGMWGAIASSGVAVGVLLGGVLTTALSWHWVFLVNVPVGIAAAALTPRLVPTTPAARERGPLDLWGGLSAVAGMAALVYALAGAADHGWGAPRTLALLAIAAALLAGFALIERSVARPLLPPSAWRSGALVAGAGMMLAATGVMAGSFFLTSVYMQGTLGWSALGSGLAFLPFVAAIAVGVHATSHTVARVGSRVLVAAGLALAAGGALLLSLASGQAGYGTGLLPGFVVLGLGLGLAFPAISITAMSDVRHDSAGLASGLLSTAHEIGAALGVAALSAIAAGPPVDYGAGVLAAAIAAGALTLLAAAVVPGVRPPAGSQAALH